MGSLQPDLFTNKSGLKTPKGLIEVSIYLETLLTL
jgi:hypothetical protein